MTMPRRIEPGATYLLTRRCAERRLRLVPNAWTRQIFEYCLARAAIRHGVQLHAWCVMSNHWHAVVTDPHGVIPDFCRDVHALVARALNAELGRWDSFWSGQGTSLVRLGSAADVLDKIAYVLTNPVAAGLVRRWSQWPGSRSGVHACARPPRECWRAGRLLRPVDAVNPPSLPLEVSVPPQFVHLGAAGFVALVNEAVEEREARLVADLRSRGVRFLGAARARSVSPRSAPKSSEARRTRDPAVAARSTPERLAMLAELVAFRRCYAAALAAWRRSGHATFPRGAFKMRDNPGVAIVGTGES